tara:strand:+ start:4603 stop:5274 length:672 start_codon:yes stop_codon:yes gene_type:complete
MAKQRQTKSQQGQFDEMGQPVGTERGEKNMDVISPPATVEAGPDVPEDEPRDLPPPQVAEAPDGGTPFSPEQRAQLLGLIRSDKEISHALLQAATQTPEGRELLNIQPGQGAPVGHYRRNYENEPHLRVTGGVEVQHDTRFRPNPPSYIKKYKAPDGFRTDLETEAMYDANDEPALTEEYKHWLDMKMAGKHLDGKVQSDMSVGAFGQETGDRFADADGLLSR